MAIIQDISEDIDNGPPGNKKMKQKFFTKHKNDILSICINKEKKIAATAEIQNIETKNCCIKIWKIENFEEISDMQIETAGINSMCFSPDDKYLVCTTLDEIHKIIVLDINKKVAISTENCGNKKIMQTIFKSNNEFISVGLNHYKYWKIENETLKYENAKIPQENLLNIGVVAVSNDKIVTGNSLGYLSLWNNEKNITSCRAFQSTVDAIFANENRIISGGRDMKIVILDNYLVKIKSFSLAENLLESLVYPIPRSIDVFSNSQNKILIGTLGGDIVEMKFENSYLFDSPQYEFHMSSHFSRNFKEKNNIIAINFWRNRGFFVTISEDCTVRFWDDRIEKQNFFLRLNEQQKLNKRDLIKDNLKPTALTFSKDEETLVIGFYSGIVRFYSTDKFQIIHEILYRKKPITSLKYSNNNQLISIASMNISGKNVIDIYKSNNYKKEYTFIAENIINNFEWSKDDKILAASSKEKKIYFYDVNDKKKIDDFLINIDEWNNWSLTFGLPLIGYYESKENRNSKIEVCEKFEEKFHDSNIIAVGDDKGYIKIYKYPVLDNSYGCVVTDIPHSGKVSGLRFLPIVLLKGETMLNSIGSDGCIYKWKICKNE